MDYSLIETPQHMSVSDRNYRLFEFLISKGYWVEPRFVYSTDENAPKLIDHLIVSVSAVDHMPMETDRT